MTITIKSLLIFVLVLLVPPSFALAHSRPANGCDLLTCIHKAFKNNPTVKNAQALADKASANLGYVESERNPDLTLTGEGGYFNGTSVSPSALVAGISSQGFALQPRSGPFINAIVTGSVPVFAEGAFRWQASHSQRAAQFGIEQARYNFQDEKLTIANAVVQAYTQLLNDRESVHTYEKVAALAKADYELAQSKYAQNLISKSELLTAEVKYSGYSTELVQAKLAMESDKRNLAYLTGGSPNLHVADIGAFNTTMPPFEALLASAQENPAIKSQRYKVQMDKQTVDKTLSQRIPTFSVDTSYGVGTGFKDHHNDVFIGGLVMDMPIFDFGRIENQASYERAEVEVDETQLNQIKLATTQALRSAYYQVLVQESQIQLYDQQVEQTEEAMKLNESQFKHNLISLGTYHDSVIAVLAAKLLRAQAAQDCYRYILQVRMLAAKGWNDGIVQASYKTP